jgi:hypothetical protein
MEEPKSIPTDPTVLDVLMVMRRNPIVPIVVFAQMAAMNLFRTEETVRGVPIILKQIAIVPIAQDVLMERPKLELAAPTALFVPEISNQFVRVVAYVVLMVV